MNFLLQKIESFKIIQKDKGLVEILKGSSVSFFMKVLGLGCGQLFAFVVARLLGAEAFGVFSLSLSLLTIFSIIGTGGLDTGLLRFIAADSARGNSGGINSNYISSLLIAIPLSLAISFLGYHYSGFIAASLFNKPDLTVYFRIASFGIFPLTMIKLNSQGLRGFKEIGRYTFISFVSRYFFGLLLLVPFYYLLFEDNRAVIYSFVAGLCIITVLSFYWILNKIDLEHVNISRERYKGIMSISLPLMLASSLQFIKGWIDTLMLGYFMSNSAVGIYNISLKVAGLTSLTLTAVNIIAAPKFAEHYGENDMEALKKTISQSTRLIFFSTIPFLLVFLTIPDFVLSFFGPEFKAGSSALMILTAGYFANSLAGSVGYLMQMTGKQLAFQNITLLTAILGIALNYYLIPLMGIKGAAVSTMIGLIFWNGTSAVYLKFRYGLTTYYNPFSSIRDE